MAAASEAVEIFHVMVVASRGSPKIGRYGVVFLGNDPEPTAWGRSGNKLTSALPPYCAMLGPITGGGAPRGYRCNVCVVVARIRRPMNIAKDAGLPSE